MNELLSATTGNGARAGQVSRMLVPTDFSEDAESALEFALALAKKTGARLEVMHVNTVYKPEQFGRFEDAEFAEDVRECLEEKTLERLRALCERVNAPEGTITIAQTHHSPVLAVVEQAEMSRADLIVIGTHGRRGLGRMLLGSIAEEVVHRAHGSSVLVVGAAVDVGAIKQILVPTDLSAHARRGVDAARAFANLFGADLHILHVVEPIPLPAAVAAGTRGLYDYVPKVRGVILEEMTKMYGGRNGDVDDGMWPRVFHHVEQGHAARSILDFAESNDIDLIVLSSQGGSSAPPFFVGSVADRVVRATSSPVLVVR